MNSSFKRVVETGYDRVAERYLASKDLEDPTTLAALEELAGELPPGAAVLDLGCGAGVPRAEHPALIGNVRRWLKPGGGFLATWALGEWEGDWEGWGAPMRWSHYDGQTSLRLLRGAGFAVEQAEARTTRGTRGDESWLWVLARRPL